MKNANMYSDAFSRKWLLGVGRGKFRMPQKDKEKKNNYHLVLIP